MGYGWGGLERGAMRVHAVFTSYLFAPQELPTVQLPLSPLRVGRGGAHQEKGLVARREGIGWSDGREHARSEGVRVCEGECVGVLLQRETPRVGGVLLALVTFPVSLAIASHDCTTQH